MTDLFYSRAASLDEIRTSQHPSDEELDLLLQLIDDEQLARYFFHNCPLGLITDIFLDSIWAKSGFVVTKWSQRVTV